MVEWEYRKCKYILKFKNRKKYLWCIGIILLKLNYICN